MNIGNNNLHLVHSMHYIKTLFNQRTLFALNMLPMTHESLTEVKTLTRHSRRELPAQQVRQAQRQYRCHTPADPVSNITQHLTVCPPGNASHWLNIIYMGLGVGGEGGVGDGGETVGGVGVRIG